MKLQPQTAVSELKKGKAFYVVHMYCVNGLSSKALEVYMPQVWCVWRGVPVCRLTRFSHTLHDLSGMLPVEAR